MSKLLVRIVGGLLAIVLIAAASFYLALYPRHYAADDFENLSAISSAAAGLRGAGKRGTISTEAWPQDIRALKPQEVRVYPSGVLIRLRGFFSYESGLYVPAEHVAVNLERLQDPTYVPLGSGVYSYKVEG